MRAHLMSCMALMLLNQSATADTAQWLGGSGNWSNAAQWNPNTVPNNGVTHYQATVNSGGADTVTLDLNPNVDSLSLGATSGANTSTLGISGQTLTLGDATVVPVLQVNAKGVANVGAGGTLALDLRAGNSTANANTGAINLTGGTLALTGGTANAFTLAGAGATTLNGGTIQGSGAEAVTITGPISGSGTIADLASFRIQSSITVGSGQSLNVQNVDTLLLESACCSNNALVVNGGSAAISGDIQLNPLNTSTFVAAGISVSNGGTLAVNGALKQNPAFTSYFGGGVSVQGTGTSFSAKGGNFLGSYNVGAGSMADLRGGTWTAYDAGTNTLNLNSKSLTLGGNMYFDGGPVYTATAAITLQGGGLKYGAGAGTDALANLTKANSLTVKKGAVDPTHLSITPNGGIFTGTATVGTSGQADTSSLTINGAFGSGTPGAPNFSSTAGTVTANQGTSFSAQGGSLIGASAALGATVDLRGGALANYNAGTQTLSGFSVQSNPVFNAFGGAIHYDGGPVQTIADTVWVAFGASGGSNGSITAWNGGVGVDPFANLDTLQGRLSISNPTYTITPTSGTLTMQKVNFDPSLEIGSAAGAGTSVVTINGALVDNGRLKVNDGSTLFTHGFTNNSTPTGPNFGVSIGTGSLLDTRGGAFGSLDGSGTLAAASYFIGANGQFLYDGGDIKTLNAKITLDGAGAAVRHGAGAGTDAFGTLTAIGGSLALNTGAAYNITPDGGTLTLNGTANGTGFINISASNTAAPGTSITVNGNMQLNDPSGNIAIQVTTKDSSFVVNGNVTGSGGININGQNSLFKVTGDYTQTAGSFTTSFGSNGPQPFEIGGSVVKSGSMNLGPQTMNVGGNFSNLAGSFSVGNGSNGTGRGTLNIGGNLVNNASFSVLSSFFSTTVLGGIVNVAHDAQNTKTITIGGNSTNSRSGEMHVAGNFDNTATATLTGANQSVALAGGNPAVLAVGGNFTNAGTVNLGTNNNATVTGSYTQTAGKTRVGAGGTLSASGFYLQGGSMGGAGTYQGDVHVSGGTFAPGDPTTTTITGNYEQSGGILSMVIGSAFSYDQIHISNDMVISGGTLKITYLPGYVPHNGDFIQLFSVGNQFIGDWSSYDFQALPIDFRFVAQINDAGFGLLVLPEPATWLLLAAGAALGGRRLGRKAQ